MVVDETSVVSGFDLRAFFVFTFLSLHLIRYNNNNYRININYITQINWTFDLQFLSEIIKILDSKQKLVVAAYLLFCGLSPFPRSRLFVVIISLFYALRFCLLLPHGTGLWIRSWVIVYTFALEVNHFPYTAPDVGYRFAPVTCALHLNQ